MKNVFLPLGLERALRTTREKAPTGSMLDTSQGMAILYYRGEALGAFTVAFCQQWAAGDAEYRWEKI